MQSQSKPKQNYILLIQPIIVFCNKIQSVANTIACVIATVTLLPPGGKDRIIPGVNKKNKTAVKINLIKSILLNI